LYWEVVQPHFYSRFSGKNAETPPVFNIIDLLPKTLLLKTVF